MKFSQKTILVEKIKESLASVLPVTGIVMLLLITLAPIYAPHVLSFIVGAVLLIFGMGLFTLGAEAAMMPMGEYVGSKITKTKKLWVIVLISLFVGTMITMSEPDLSVLAGQVKMNSLVLFVSLGVGIMLVIAMLRIIFKVRLKYLLLGFYALVFVFAFFIPESFLAVSFDSGGVTTGPMTVPFIMSLGVGVASIRADEGSNGDSFGLVALCSVGPILAVMVLGLFNSVSGLTPTPYIIPPANTSQEIFMLFITQMPHYAWEVVRAIGPIVLFFLLFQAFSGGVGKKRLGKISIGVLYTFVGLTLFLTGVNVGFMPLGKLLGESLAGSDAEWIKWLIIPIGMIIGYFIVAAEPAVHVLTKQVEDETSGAIPGKVLSLTLSIGVAVSVGIAMLRVLTGLPILYVLVPGYAIALLLSFFVPDVFTSIAFDSGGVASGPMTATFLLPFAVGACSAINGNLDRVVYDAFGVVAMVAMTPLIAIQILGLVYQIKSKKAGTAASVDEVVNTDEDGQITIDFDAVVAQPEEQQPVADDSDDIIDF